MVATRALNIADPSSFMDKRLRALFVHDDYNRITHCRMGSAIDQRCPVPKLHIGRTRNGNIWRFHADLPDDLIQQLQPQLNALPPLPVDFFSSTPTTKRLSTVRTGRICRRAA